MNDISWANKVQFVHKRAQYLCEYCQTGQHVTGQAMHVEHIDPHGGDDLDNLCLSCPSCNLSKAKATSAVDPDSSETVPIFNPRVQIWSEHFQWIQNGLLLLGLTSIGRATILRLKMNNPRIVNARKVWIRAGEHPPNTSKE